METPRDKSIYNKFYTAFLEFFKNSNVDFWSESSAPEELATIASNMVFEFQKPIMDVFLKNGPKEEYEAAYREYLNRTRI